ASFDWGFGISHAGFSDIIHFYEHCNIPDWVTLEAGDPQTEAAKLRDRSPLYHADQMTGKLLLTHGTNDSRVPIAGSRMMADSLRK
ncbi:MAG: prolyl oligopeptidase family serine peptidase, partial [Calditrichaeota bacterium]|nr:prolyl oligopeptidase family serine peptidase [Calditrichota bacterium]